MNITTEPLLSLVVVVFP